MGNLPAVYNTAILGLADDFGDGFRLIELTHLRFHQSERFVSGHSKTIHLAAESTPDYGSVRRPPHGRGAGRRDRPPPR
jgi:hypothetical protein